MWPYPGRVFAVGPAHTYVFDLGDDRTRCCTVDEGNIDPADMLGVIPPTPTAYWGWGTIPDQLAASVASVPTVQPDHAKEVTATTHIRAAMAKLSPRDEEVLQLIAWEDLDIADAATVLGCSNTACKVRLHRARRRLALMLYVAPDLRNDQLSKAELPEVVV